MRDNNLDQVLKKHLGRVEAPVGLWNHVRGPVHPPKPVVAWHSWAAAAAALTIVAAGWGVWRQFQEPSTVEAMAVAALEREPQELTLQTSDATSVRKWLRSAAGLDIPLPPKHSDVIQIHGARVNEAGLAEISYQAGEFQVALLVSKNSDGVSGYPSHDFRGSDPYETARVTSWSLKGQSYTLAWSAPGEFRTACLLCHDQEPPVLPPGAVN